ncbi:MAG TPA: hypothetical protein VE687_20030 [Stellaceae bacterium]|nr:hypothetical protein [Stellaceae bacterium]
MPNLLERCAARVELDQRSREARLRLQQVERLFAPHPLPRQSLLRRLLRCLGSRNYVGETIVACLANPTVTGNQRRREQQIPDEPGFAAEGFAALPPAAWPNCRGNARAGEPALARGPVPPPGFHRW